ncbi:hypothetical protein [Rhizocola hellebori]|nr:hypothetical protein [Rhizocola hellebori]
MSLLMCETADVPPYVASDKLRAAKKAFDEAEAVYEAALERLRQAVIEEVALPTRPIDVGREVGWHPGHVRRLAREAGVPKLVDREPPRRSDH